MLLLRTLAQHQVYTIGVMIMDKHPPPGNIDNTLVLCILYILYIIIFMDSGQTISRKLECSLGLERLSSARAGFVIDELGQEPQF